MSKFDDMKQDRKKTIQSDELNSPLAKDMPMLSVRLPQDEIDYVKRVAFF